MRTRHQVCSESIAGSLGDDDRDTYRLTSEIVFDGELPGGRYKLEVFIEGSHGTRIGVIATTPLLDAPFSTRCFLSLAARLTPLRLAPLQRTVKESFRDTVAISKERRRRVREADLDGRRPDLTSRTLQALRRHDRQPP